MTADEFAAIEQARALLLLPAQVGALRSRAFPSGMRTLLRVAAGDESILELAAQRTGDTPTALREASLFYVQQIMLDDASDSYRVLGVDAGTPVPEIKAHYGLLMRWMHPDRNPDAWDAVFAERVTRAWNDLRTPDRRLAYDAARAAPAAAENEDWTEQAAPYRAPPERMAKVHQFAPIGLARPAPAFMASQRALAAAALAGVAALALLVVWPTNDGDERSPEAYTAAIAPDQSAAGALSEVVPSTSRASIPSPLLRERNGVPVVASVPSATATTRTGRLSPPPETLPGRGTPMRAISSSATDARANASALAGEPQVPSRVERETSSGIEARALSDHSFAGATPTAPVRKGSGASESSITQAPLAVVAMAPEARAETEPAAPDLDQAGLLIGRFARAYQRGDIDALAALFAADARSQGGGIAQIRAAYDRLFERTSQRSISIRNIQWQIVDERALATGRFEISQARDKESKAQISRGTIRFDIEQREDQLLIARLEHVDRG